MVLYSLFPVPTSLGIDTLISELFSATSGIETTICFSCNLSLIMKSNLLLSFIFCTAIVKLFPILDISPISPHNSILLLPSLNTILPLGLITFFISLPFPVVALVSFLVTALVMTRAKGFLKIIPFLIGIITGYIVAVCLGMIEFKPVAEASWFSLPKFKVMFLDYGLDFTALITIAPIALVTLCEHIGDHTSLSNIIGRNLLKEPGLDRTLLGDGLATFVAGFLGGPANTTYGENTSVVGMTRVASVKVIGLAAIFAIILGFLGKFTSVVSTIPNAVLGGVSLLLYGFIAVNGLKVLIKNQVNFEDPKNIIVASSMFVLGLGGAAVSIVSGDLSLSISGMSLAAIVGIILNGILKGEKEDELIIEKVKTNYPQSDKEINRIKKEIKSELTIELKEDIISEIRKEMNKTQSKKMKKK